MNILEQYRLIGLENFMAYLDKHKPGNYKIKEASHTVPERNSLQRLKVKIEDRRSLEVLGKAPADIADLFSGNSEETVARISTEGGNFAHGPGFYEFIKIRILQPIPLSSKLIIPESTVKIYVAAPEWTKPAVERRDHVRKLWGLIWKRTDLRDILPDSLFLRDPEENYDRVSRRASYRSPVPQ